MIGTDDFRKAVDAYLERTKTPPTVFGKEVLKDPNFVFELRKGRSPSLEIAQRVWDAMERNGTGAATPAIP